MAMLKSGKHIAVFCSMMLLILSNCGLFATLGIQSYFEYGAYFLLLCCVMFYFLIGKKPKISIGINLIVCAVVSLLFCVGILVQDLALSIKLRLAATMLVISFTAILGEDFINSLDTIRVAAYGIFAGTILTTLLCLLTGHPIIEFVYEGWMPYGFTGGLLYKNFYAAILLGSFIGLFFYHRYGRATAFDKNIMAVQVILILLANAKGTYIFLAVFLILANLKQIKQLIQKIPMYRQVEEIWQQWDKPLRKIVTIGGLVIAGLLFVWVFIMLITISENYAIRYRGVFGYLNYVKGDWFGIIFGNAGTVWGDPELDYIATLRKLIHWNTSYEVAFLNTLIKNGLLGLLGFGLMFAHIAVTAHRTGTRETKTMTYLVLIVLLISALVESFASNIHSIFGIICYLYMAGLCGMGRMARSDGQACISPLGSVFPGIKKR